MDARDFTPYQLGYCQGLRAYAWWKDGTMYVGTTGTTLRRAVVRFLVEAGHSEGAAEAAYDRGRV